MNRTKGGKIFRLLAVLLATTVFSPVITTIPVAVGEETQPLTLYCKEKAGKNPENPQTSLTVDLPVKEIIGETVTAYATLTDSNGDPIVAAPVHFYVGGENAPPIWVGHAVTDCDGVAILRFTRNEAGPIVVTAKFDGGNGLMPNEITATLELIRLAQPEPGIVEIGSIGITLLLVLIVSFAILGAVLAVREDKKTQTSE